MNLLTIKVTDTEKGFSLLIESDNEELRAEWGERILAFFAGKCGCGCGCGGGSCGCHGDEEEKGEAKEGSCCS